jgi:hypothetical protein
MAQLKSSKVNGDLEVTGKIKGESFEISIDGLSVAMVNKTGLNPETQETQGTIVSVDDTTDGAVKIAPANSEAPYGLIRDSGVLADANIWITNEGKSLVLLKDGVGCTKGEFAYVSDVAGRAASTSVRATAGYKAFAIFTETKTSGTDVLANVVML